VTDKSELLQQLKIDRNLPPEAKEICIWQLILVVIVCIMLTVWLTLYFLVPDNSSSTEITADELATKLSTTLSTEAKKVSASDGSSSKLTDISENTSILNSSGYITARRMATVSSEVMGLIIEVNVEEGMNVEQGQVLARLDKAKSVYQRVLNNNAYSSDAERTRAFATQQSLIANSNNETDTSTEQAFNKAFIDQIGNIGLIIFGVVFMAFFTILIVVGNTMVLAIRERTNEIAVLKTLGFESGRIFKMVLIESCLLAFLGGMLGIGAAYIIVTGASEQMARFLPNLALDQDVLLQALAYMLAMGLITGIAPAISALRLNIITAFSRG
jgi:ABC-type antimicrobial peptide transport system permease subunit